MSLVYLLTHLPALELGKDPPLSRDAFAETARSLLTGFARKELEQVLLLNEIDKTVRARNHEQLGLPIDENDASFADYQHRRALVADANDHLMPSWVLKKRPLHLLMRYWFQTAYRHGRSSFLKRYARLWLNLEEMIAGQLCKQEGMERRAFMAQMEGGFDSTWRMMVGNYETEDLGIGNRLRTYSYIKEIMQYTDLGDMESRFDEVRWKLIDRCLGTETFNVDQVLGYFFRLRLVERVAARDFDAGNKCLDEILNHQPEKI